MGQRASNSAAGLQSQRTSKHKIHPLPHSTRPRHAAKGITLTVQDPSSSQHTGARAVEVTTSTVQETSSTTVVEKGSSIAPGSSKRTYKAPDPLEVNDYVVARIHKLSRATGNKKGKLVPQVVGPFCIEAFADFTHQVALFVDGNGLTWKKRTADLSKYDIDDIVDDVGPSKTSAADIVVAAHAQLVVIRSILQIIAVPHAAPFAILNLTKLTCGADVVVAAYASGLTTSWHKWYSILFRMACTYFFWEGVGSQL